MKERDFLNSIVRQKKIFMIPQNKLLCEAYMQKSHSNFCCANILKQNNCLEESIVLAYYSAYHLVTALFFRVGLRSENHTASILLLKSIFKLDNRFLLKTKSERIDKQYYAPVEIAKEEVQDFLRQAKETNEILIYYIQRMENPEKFRNQILELFT